MTTMNIAEFIAKWGKAELKERSAAQEHFLDLCNVFAHPTPAAADPIGEKFCFEKGAAKHGGGDGFADVWKRGFFGWEYKGKHKDLSAAYDQLLRYRDALENPPLLVLCDLDRLVIRTNFTGTVSAVHEIPLSTLAEPRNIEIMRAVFHNPEALRPGRTSAAVTQEAAVRIGEIAAAMRGRDLDPAAVAHFLDRIVFCLFAEDASLLPDMVFTRIVAKSGDDPVRFGKILGELFDTMATGGDFGLESIRHFNGNLFDDRTVLDLTDLDVKRIAAAASLDWSAVDPSIFGTLFERGLDPAKRSQLGAHFTGRDDIELVVDAVVMVPLRRAWDETKAIVERLLTTGRKTPTAADAKTKPLSDAALRKAREEAAQYEKPFEYVKTHVLPAREKRRDDYRGMWWQYARPRPEMRTALKGKSRYIATPRVSKYRIFIWLDAVVVANDGTIVFARDDDAFFGILHSRIHEVWARAQGTQLREAESGCRYTPTTSFETFPMPSATEAIATEARDLVVKREHWLNPEGASPAELKLRTLTKLYNARPAWLEDCHARLDAAVAAAYGWPTNISDDAILERLLVLNLEK